MPYRDMDLEEEDDLGAARGVLNALLPSLGIWLIIGFIGWCLFH